MESPQRIAVVGGGIAGLTCAYELERAGKTVSVFESEPTPGGRMRSREVDGLMFDIGATHLIPLYTHMLKYIEEFDIGWEQMLFEQYGLVRKGKISPIEKGMGPLSYGRLGKTMAKVARAHGKEHRNTYDFNEWVDEDTEDAYTYLKREAGRKVADYIGDAFTAAYQFHLSKDASRGALMAMMDSIVQNRNGWMLHHMKRGMSALPDAFAQRLGDVRLSTPVESVVPGENGVTVNTANGPEEFDAVVMATPSFVTARLLDSPTPEQQALFDATEYAATISLAFRLPKDVLPKFSITWVPHVENDKFSGISNEQMKGDDVSKDGDTLVATWLHHEYALTMLDKTDEEIFEETRREFVAMCPWVDSEEMLEPYDLQRWPAAMPIFKAGSLTRVQEFEENHQGERNIYLCGDYMNSPWTEGALQNGQRVAAQVLEDLPA